MGQNRLACANIKAMSALFMERSLEFVKQDPFSRYVLWRYNTDFFVNFSGNDDAHADFFVHATLESFRFGTKTKTKTKTRTRRKLFFFATAKSSNFFVFN